MRSLLPLGLCAALAAPTLAHADVVVAYDDDVTVERGGPDIACCVGLHNFATDVAIDVPQFDASLGTLDAVRLKLDIADQTFSVVLDNETTAQTGTLTFISDVRVVIDDGSTTGDQLALKNDYKTVTGISLGSDSDGEPDFVGSDTWSHTRTISGHPSAYGLDSAYLADFTGSGDIELLVRNGSRVGGGLFYSDAAMQVAPFEDMEVNVVVEYVYTPSCVEVDGVGCDMVEVFGFEDDSLWSAGSTVSSPVTAGSGALAVTASGWTPIKSDPFSGEDLTPTGTLAVDVFIPSSPPNPYWIGDVQALVDCPADGVYNAWLGYQGLTGKTLGAYNTLTFPVSTSVQAALASTNDCTIELDLNAPSGGAPFVFDNLRFLP